MSAILRSIDDPRDSLERAKRYELVAYAQANGLKQVTPEMPAILIRKILRSRGLTRISIPPRVLGSPQGGLTPNADGLTSASGAEVDAADDLMRQWMAEQKQERTFEPKPRTVDEMSMQELRKEAKRLGLGQTPRDTMQTLRDKLKAHANG